MKNIILTSLALMMLGLSAQASSENEAKKCELSIEAKSTNGHGFLLIETFPTIQTHSVEDCYQQAVNLAHKMVEVEGVSFDTSTLQTRKSKVSWRKVVSWSVDDRMVWNSSGKVTPFSANCMKAANDTTVTGDKLFWRGCESF